MASFTTQMLRFARQARERVRYQELETGSYEDIAKVDAFSRARGEEPTTFGSALEDSIARSGFTRDEIDEIEQQPRFRPEFDEDDPFGGTQPETAASRFLARPPPEPDTDGSNLLQGVLGASSFGQVARFGQVALEAVKALPEVFTSREGGVGPVARFARTEAGQEAVAPLIPEAILNLEDLDRLGGAVRAALSPEGPASSIVTDPAETARRVGRGLADPLSVQGRNIIGIRDLSDEDRKILLGFSLRDWAGMAAEIVVDPVDVGAGGSIAEVLVRRGLSSSGAQTAARLPAVINALTDPATLRAAQPEAATRAASVEPPPLALTARRLAEEGRGQARGGAPDLPSQGPLTELESIQSEILDAFTRGQRLVETGEPAAALKAQQARQAAGIERTTPTASTFEEATAGARVTDKLSEQQPLPKLELSPSQEAVVVENAAQLLREREILPFDMAAARTVIDRLRAGQPPRPFELASENLRKIFGDDVMNAWGAAARRAPSGDLPPAPQSIVSKQIGATLPAGPRPFGAPATALPQVAGASRLRAQKIADPFANIPPERAPFVPEAPARARPLAEGEQGRVLPRRGEAAPSTVRIVPSASGSLPPLPRADPSTQLAKGLEDARIKEVNARNRENLQQLRETERFNQQAMIRQANALTADEARIFRQGAIAKERVLNIAPNSDELLQRVGDFMNRPAPGTPRADAAGLVPIPRVSNEIQEVVRNTIEYWLRGTDAILEPMADAGVGTIRAIQAYGLGQLESPYLTAAVQRMNTLRGVLTTLGMDAQAAGKVSDLMISHQFARRYGDGFTEIRLARLGDARVRARGRVRADARANGEPAPTGADLTRQTDALVDEELEAMFRETHGALVDTEKRVNDQLELAKPTESFRSLETFVQRGKNSMFAIDASIVGIQLRSALIRGGVPLFARAIMKIADTMGLPNARHIYSDGLLPRQIQAALDGVDQTSLTSAFRQDEGSILAYSLPQKIPGVPFVERQYSRAANKINELSFGTALTATRNWAYEGELFTLHLLGEDITDPLVRQAAAISANNIGSSSAVSVRGGRNRLETVLATSVRMSRARAKNVELMARVFDPRSGVTPAERKLGAMMIMSTVGNTLFMGYVMNNLIGMSDFEFDPGLPGFGLITIPDGEGGGRVIDLFPQDSVIRAFARSVNALKEQDADEAINQWLKVYVGSASIVGKLPATLFDYGYEAGRGFTEDLTTKGKILNMAPLPIPIINGIAEGWDAIGVALESVGIGEFDESVFSEEERILREAGFDPDAKRGEEGFIAPSDRDAELQKAGELEQLQTRDEEETREQAASGIRSAQARLVSFDLRNALNEIAYGEDGELIAKPLYRELRRDPQADAVSKRRGFQDVYDSWGESDDPIVRLAGERWALIGEAEHPITKAVNWEVLEEAQGRFDATLTPSDREAMMQIINAINVNDNPLEQEFDLLRADLGNAGWWEIDDVLWAEMVASNQAILQGVASIREFELNEKDRIRKSAREEGFAAGEIEGLVRSLWAKNSINQEWTEDRRERRTDWAFESTAHLELASQASEWTFWAATDDAEAAFLNTLGPAQQ